MRSLRILLLAPFLSACANTLSPDRDDVVLVNATLESSEFLSEPTTQFRDGEMIINGAPVKLEFRAHLVLIGHTDQVEITGTVNRTHDLMPGLDYFLLETRDAGTLEPRWFDLANDGLCIPETKQKEFGIEREVGELQKIYPCTAHLN